VPTDYGYCSDEGQRCAFSGTAQIYYGANDHFNGPLTFTGGVDCNSDVLGDPIPGTSKQCFINGGRPEGSTWCANQDGACNFGTNNIATVYYGANGKYSTKTGVVTSIACNSGTFGDPFPDLVKFCYYIVTGRITILTKSFVSNAAQDGFILESSETSNLGGIANSTAMTLPVGDNVANKQYRAVLSFGTGALPDNAVITSVTLKIRKSGQVGTNAFSTLGGIAVDIMKGPFSGNAALQPADFQAVPSKSAALTMSDNPVSGWYSRALSSSSFGYINLTGMTQFRLRFVTDDNNNAAPDFVAFYSGNYVPTTADYRPLLIITYSLP
jgi:hypothetical protein